MAMTKRSHLDVPLYWMESWYPGVGRLLKDAAAVIAVPERSDETCLEEIVRLSRAEVPDLVPFGVFIRDGWNKDHVTAFSRASRSTDRSNLFAVLDVTGANPDVLGQIDISAGADAFFVDVSGLPNAGRFIEMLGASRLGMNLIVDLSTLDEAGRASTCIHDLLLPWARNSEQGWVAAKLSGKQFSEVRSEVWEEVLFLQPIGKKYIE